MEAAAVSVLVEGAVERQGLQPRALQVRVGLGKQCCSQEQNSLSALIHVRLLQAQ